MLEIIESNLMEILVALLTGLATYIGARLKKIYEEKVNTETKEKVVKTCVNATEQLYKDLDGTEKLEKAKENILAMLNEKGLSITDLELDLMIEEVVNGFNKGTTKTK
jgi:intergrase/recombinase